MARLEKTFQTEFKHAVDTFINNHRPLHYYKIPDDGIGYRPYDCFVVDRGLHIAIELKMIKTKKTFNFASMFKGREHQIHYLKRVERCGGVGLVIINHYNLSPRINMAYALRISDFNISEVLSIAELQDRAFIINKISRGKNMKGLVWDIAEILTYYAKRNV